MPLPLFLAYRILLFLYTLAWLILHIVARESYGPRWLIFISDWAFALLTFSTGAMAIICLVYTIIHYTNSKRLLQYIPRRDFPIYRVFKQDNIHWSVKIAWLLYVVAKTAAVLIFAGYWVFIYESCEEQGAFDSRDDNDTFDPDTMEMNVSTTDSLSCSPLDIYTIHIHGVNVVIVLLDIFMSRVPYQFLHLFYPCLFTLVYVIFSLIYWGAGGTNLDGDPFIYSTLDYNSGASTFGLAILLILVPPVFYLVLFLLAWARDALYGHIACCFRDIKVTPYQDKPYTAEHEGTNGTADEITKV